MPIPVARLAPFKQWDQNVLDQLFAGDLYPTGLDFTRHDGYISHVDGAIVIIPGRYWHHNTKQIELVLRQYKWVLAIRTGDEEDLFKPDQIEHPNIKWWIQTPRPDSYYCGARLFGVGYTPHFNNLGKIPTPVNKTLDVFLWAQNTHQRRRECFAALTRFSGSEAEINATDGFTKGLIPAGYAAAMTCAKVAPAPAGPASPDTFRLYEALEAHTIPIADDITPGYDSAGYWRTVHPDAPFLILTDYDHLPAYIDAMLTDWPHHANRITAWWIAYKRQMARWLRADLHALGAL